MLQIMGRVVRLAVLVTTAAAAGYLLAERFGGPTALVIWAAVAAAACIVGAVLLRTSRIGRVTWKNHVAGYLIPWGWRLNRGRLWPIPVVSWVVWVAVGGAAILLRHRAEAGELAVRAGLFAAWLVDGAAAAYLLGTIRQATPGGRVGSLWKLVAIVAGILAASVSLFVCGEPWAALMVGGGPPLAVGAAFALVMLLPLTIGRNTRWN